jgi:hypothetical protein
VLGSSGYLGVIIAAFFCGCVTSGIISDRVGRRQCSILLHNLRGDGADLHLRAAHQCANAGARLSLGLLRRGHSRQHGGTVFRTLSGRRARDGVGFCYNFGRVISAAFPFMVGLLADRIGLGPAIGIDAAFAYSLVLIAVLMLPETRGKVFEQQPAALRG